MEVSKKVQRLSEVLSGIAGIPISATECVALINATQQLLPFGPGFTFVDLGWFRPGNERTGEFYSLFYVPSGDLDDPFPPWLSDHKLDGKPTMPASLVEEASRQTGILHGLVTRSTPCVRTSRISVERVLSVLKVVKRTNGIFLCSGSIEQHGVVSPKDVLIFNVTVSKSRLGFHKYSFQAYVNTITNAPVSEGMFMGKEVKYADD